MARVAQAITRASVIRSYLVAILVWVIAFLVALKIGAVEGADLEMVVQLRLSRAILATAVGAGLAVSGAVLQALFANPLCEPYTLGISSGSAVGAVIGAVLGLEWIIAGLAGTAFLGALLFALVLYLVSLKPGTSNLTILLTGVMLGFLGSSLVAVWMALGDPNGIQSAIFWILGDLSRARFRGAIFSLGTVTSLVCILWGKWRQLDALLMGEEGAMSLGVEVRPVRRHLIVTLALLIGVCVSSSGMIGFVGLVVPHFCRKFVGSLHQKLLPLCAIWGSAALTIADALARFVARPYELPVGVVTSLIGVPIFLWVMLTREERA